MWYTPGTRTATVAGSSTASSAAAMHLHTEIQAAQRGKIDSRVTHNHTLDICTKHRPVKISGSDVWHILLVRHNLPWVRHHPSQLRKQQHVHRDLQHEPKGSTCKARRHAPTAIRQAGAARSIRDTLTAALSPVALRLERPAQPLTSLLAAATACGPFGHTQQRQQNPKSTAAIAFLPPPPPAPARNTH